jgi:hypothetical protein
MNRTTRSLAITLTTCLSILLTVSSGLIVNRASAANQRGNNRDKVGTHLREHVSGNSGNDDKVNVIVQLNGSSSGRLDALLSRNGIHVKKQFKNFNSFLLKSSMNWPHSMRSIL